MNAACLLPLAIALTLPRPVQDPPPTDDPRFEDRVDVERITLDARVLGDRGEPRLGLTARDFRLRIDGRVVPVESAYWVDGATPYAEGLTPSEAASVGAEAAAPGRLLVFFFQKSLERTRAPGLLRMVAEAHGLVDSLNDGDRVAIVSFDSHLKLWTDFTGDRATLHAIIERSILFGERRPRRATARSRRSRTRSTTAPRATPGRPRRACWCSAKRCARCLARSRSCSSGTAWAAWRARPASR